MADPPTSADLIARIAADIKRDGYSLIKYEELRVAWPEEFATAMQLGLISMIAQEQGWSFEFLPGGVRFAPTDP